MPSRDFDAIFYVKNPPDIRIEEGLFHIGYDIGKRVRFEVVLTPATFFKARQCAARVADDFHEGCHGKVSSIKGRTPGH